MNLQWLKARQTRYGFYVTVYVLVVMVALGVANFLAQRHNKSFDATANKRFSLSDQTLKLVKGLKQDVKLTYFHNASQFAGARDMLDRYDNLSTKLSVEFVDPDKKPQLARAMGLKSLGTVFVQVGAKREEAKSTSEEELTGALIRAMKGGQRTLCAVSGSGEHSLEESERAGYSALKELVEKNNYKTQTISLLSNPQAAAEAKQGAPKEFKPQIPKECNVVLVGGPRFDYPEPAVNAVKTWVESGGSAILMLDPPVKLGREEIGDNAGLGKLVESWGVTLGKDLVLDTSGIGQIFGLSAVVPLVSNYEFHSIVREMKGVATAFPLTRSLETKSGDKTTVDKLFATSANSFATANLSSAEIDINPGKDKKGPFTLAAAGTYNTGKENLKGRFVVVGSSGWVANNILRFNGNRDLALNMLNWLSADEDLISIRPKEPEDRRLSLSKGQMATVRNLTVFALPLLVIAAGIRVWWRRR